MKIGETWLREWVNPSLPLEAIAEQLTFAGLEVEGWETVEGDTVLEIALTPNRGDCLSIFGIAREVAVLNKILLKERPIVPVAATIGERRVVTVDAPAMCPRYLGRLIQGIRSDVVLPEWMQARLVQSEINLIHPVVDIINYVMLEYGQPMHAFDAKKLAGEITIRVAKAGESITVLGGQSIALSDSILVIADDNGPQAIAGIIGGVASAVGEQTVDLFLESALFTAEKIAGKARQLGLHTESSYRFERGVDPQLAEKAMERATELILTYCGGMSGPVVEWVAKSDMPVRGAILFRPSRFERVIGEQVSFAKLRAILELLSCCVEERGEHWMVAVPSYRSDLNEEIDLIEELARIIGYSALKMELAPMRMGFTGLPEGEVSSDRIREMMADWGYQEVITYSFVEEASQRRLFPDVKPFALVNPISSEMGVMRWSTWTGLLSTVRYNQHRQHVRLKLFEIGQCFRAAGEVWQDYLGVVIVGGVLPEHWGVSKREVDFYDLKGQVEGLFRAVGNSEALSFRAASVWACHPGQCAEILYAGEVVGIMGRLHPKVQREWDIEGAVYLMEVNLSALKSRTLSTFSKPSRFPENRRDIAIVVEQEVLGESLVQCVKREAGELLQDVIVFDVYIGKGIDPGKKSVAMGLILQHPSRTLVDDEMDAIVGRVCVGLAKEFQAKLRN